jgi:hypothetical protein
MRRSHAEGQRARSPEALVRERRRVDVTLRPAGSGGGRSSGVAPGVSAGVAEQPARAGARGSDPPESPAALVGRVVLAVDQQDQRRSSPRARSELSDDERLLVREGHDLPAATAASSGGPPRPRGPRHEVGLLVPRDSPEPATPDDPRSGREHPRGAPPRPRPRPGAAMPEGLLGEALRAAPAPSATTRNFRMALHDVARASPDRAGGAQDRHPLHDPPMSRKRME